jgi:hypothetical protein
MNEMKRTVEDGDEWRTLKVKLLSRSGQRHE